MMLQENTVVADRFRLVRMIGRGGMGSVWRAFDTRLDTPCAVKFIEGELANVAEAHARFEREAKAAAALRSPHVVEIKDHGVWQGTPYIAMELLEGEDLGKFLAKSGGKLAPAQVSSIMEQVCRALTKAHAAGIVHRDLKPDNIFIVNDDDRQLVKILDFGVAKSASQTLDGSNTKTGAMLGTPYYMSPEQAQGIKSVDSRSDLWSLAVIVYQCITGRLPFESEALGDLLVKIIVQPVPVPSSVAVVPPGFDRWWAKAAERNPEGRFQHAKEFSMTLSLAVGTSSLNESVPHARGTAMMNQGPGAVFVTPSPFGGQQPGATTQPNQATPHPTNPTPGGVAMMTPVQHPSTPGVANPATFSGVEPPVSVPKKGPPVAIIAGVAVVLLLALGGGGLVVARRSAASATATPTSTATTTPSAAPTEPEPTPKAAASDVPAPASASAEPAASAAPSASASASAAASATPAPKATSVATAATGGKTSAPTTPKPAPTGSAKKKLDLGF